MSLFLRLLDTEADTKAMSLRSAVRGAPMTSRDRVAFDCDPASFSAVPGSPFAYWVTRSVREMFIRLGGFESEVRSAKQGLATANDFRFVRLRWEVPRTTTQPKWFVFAKGGAFCRYYADVSLVVNWADSGVENKAFIVQQYPYLNGDPGYVAKNTEHYFRPGVTWSLRTTSGLGVRAMPKGCVFGHKGPAAFIEGDAPEELLATAALANSALFSYLVGVQLAAADAAARSYEVGIIQRTPVPAFTDTETSMLANLARRAWSLARALDRLNETSNAFVLPSGLNERVTSLYWGASELALASIQKQIDETIYAIYQVSAEDRDAIERAAKRKPSLDSDVDNEVDDDGDDDEATAPAAEAAETLASWLVGVVFARFDPRLPTGERAIPPEPEPFDPLPSRSPGMYPEGEEPADRPDILVDDEGHADDLAARVMAIAERVKVDALENLRVWLAEEFFPLHIKMYSKSRRKAPIYWQLATPSASYSVWLYIHAFSKDTLFRVQSDYVAPKLGHEERRLESLTSELRDGGTAAQRKVLAAKEAVVDELRAFLDEVKRVAPLWKPNLDDGVIINFAPLWRLVPQNKSWQKDLKSAWDALCEGKYDWAHLAMHLWPERAVPKCAKDRSLAIAHGLEDVFWVEGADGKWTARKTPTRSVEELVRERTSPAVKSALKSLLDAPAAAGAGKRSTRGKANA
jgi:hypothetical protein